MLTSSIRDGAEWVWISRGDTCPYCQMLASRGWVKASKKVLKGNHAEHIHAHCDCEFAIRFDGKSTVEGYNPQRFKRIYDNAEGSTSSEKLNSIRRNQYPDIKGERNARRRELYAKTHILALPKQLQFFDENGERRFIPRGVDITHIKSIAGKDTNSELRTANELSEKFGGDPKDWVKKVGKVESKKYYFDIHWNKMVTAINIMLK